MRDPAPREGQGEQPEGRFVGGPLDGRPTTRYRGRWPVWRRETGEPVPTAEGDRTFLGHSDGHGPAFYVCTNDDGTYRHSSSLGRQAINP